VDIPATEEVHLNSGAEDNEKRAHDHLRLVSREGRHKIYGDICVNWTYMGSDETLEFVNYPLYQKSRTKVSSVRRPGFWILHRGCPPYRRYRSTIQCRLSSDLRHLGALTYARSFVGLGQIMHTGRRTAGVNSTFSSLIFAAQKLCDCLPTPHGEWMNEKMAYFGHWKE